MSSMNNEMRRYTYEEIHAMSGGELRELMGSYKSLLLKNRRLSTDDRDYVEVEFCYLQREMQERERWNIPRDRNRSDSKNQKNS